MQQNYGQEKKLSENSNGFHTFFLTHADMN